MLDFTLLAIFCVDDQSAAAELAQLETLKEEFAPLQKWIKDRFRSVVSDGTTQLPLVLASPFVSWWGN